MTDLDSRVARLEQKNQQYDMEFRDLKDSLKDLDEKRLAPMQKTVNALDNRLTGQRNFVAGMLFVITSIWAFVVFAVREVWLHLSGGAS